MSENPATPVRKQSDKSATERQPIALVTKTPAKNAERMMPGSAREIVAAFRGPGNFTTRGVARRTGHSTTTVTSALLHYVMDELAALRKGPGPATSATGKDEAWERRLDGLPMIRRKSA